VPVDDTWHGIAPPGPTACGAVGELTVSGTWPPCATGTLLASSRPGGPSDAEPKVQSDHSSGPASRISSTGALPSALSARFRLPTGGSAAALPLCTPAGQSPAATVSPPPDREQVAPMAAPLSSGSPGLGICTVMPVPRVATGPSGHGSSQWASSPCPPTHTVGGWGSR